MSKKNRTSPRNEYNEAVKKHEGLAKGEKTPPKIYIYDN